MTDSIIFDVDGTIWDATCVIADTWSRELSKEIDGEFFVDANTLRNLFGKPMNIIMEALFPNCDNKTRDLLANRAYVTQAECVKDNYIGLFEGLEDVLKVLYKRYPLFIVSNCQKGYIEALYSSTGIGKYFKDKLCYGDTLKYKAENIKTIIKKHNLKLPLYLGDTEGDYLSAKEAGCKFVWASYGFGKPSGYDFKIDSPSELLKILHALDIKHAV